MPLPLFLAPIISMLANKGLNALAKAVDGAGDKALDFIEEKSGIKMTDGAGQPISNLSPDQVVVLRKLESTEKVTLIRLALEKQKETNRHDEVESELIISEIADARSMYKETSHKLQDDIAKKVFKQTSFLVPLLVILNMGLIMFAKWKNIDPAVAVALGNILGFVLGKLLDERKTVIEFLFGGALGNNQRGEDDGGNSLPDALGV